MEWSKLPTQLTGQNGCSIKLPQQSMKRILFVSHDASRSGAPIVLLKFLHWLREHSELAFDVLLQYGGPLTNDFQAVADKCFLLQQQGDTNCIMRLAGRAAEKSGLNWLVLLNKLQARRYNLLYANSCVTARVLAKTIEKMSVPVILHMRELDSVILTECLDDFRRVLPSIQRFVAISDIVAKNLISNHDVPPALIEEVPTFTDSSPPCANRDYRVVKRELGIRDDAFVIGGCGSINWRKGTDLFVQVANEVLKTSTQPVHFLWLGGMHYHDGFILQQLEAERLGLGKSITFVESNPTPYDFFRINDLFLLTSREEPFGVAALQNAQLGKPVVCFEGVSGFSQLVDGTCGHVSPYLDLRDMAETVIRYSQNREMLQLHGNAIARKTKQFTIDVCAPKLLKVINDELVKSRCASP